ncbi:MAG: motility associated factor glycosyltransferase family protein, partial [Desulfotomaculales bacterium]
MNEKTTEEILKLANSLNDDEIIKQYNECTGNKQYGSYLNPEREANTWVDTFYEKDKDVFIVIGTGRLHYHIALARKLEKDQKLFILDWKLPLIAAVRSEVHALAKKTNVIFRFSRNIEEMILSIFGIFDRYATKKIKFGIIPPYQFIFPEEAQKIQEQIRNFLSVNLVRSRTIELFGMEWTTNYMRNLPHILKRGVPFKNFVNQFDGVPAVVVSAGPSLEKNVELLPQIFNKAVIIAAGSAIETLKEYGINPHFLASFDAGAGNYPHFQHLDTKQLRLIFTGDIYPRILDEFEGVLIPAESLNKPTYELYKQYGAPPLGEVLIGPSVAN